MTEQLLTQQLESPSGTGRDEPRSPQPAPPPIYRNGMLALDKPILTGQSGRLRGTGQRIGQPQNRT